MTGQGGGRALGRLAAFSGLIGVLGGALTVPFSAGVGVPVSPSQAVVGAVIGVGLLKQANAIRGAVVLRIGLGWLATPLIAFGFAVVLHFVTHLQYVP